MSCKVGAIDIHGLAGPEVRPKMLHPADIELRLHEGPPPAPEAMLKAVADPPTDAIPAVVDEASRE